MIRLFRDALHDVFGLFDLLWIGLAATAAWIGLRADDAEKVSATAQQPAPLPAEPPRRSRNPVDRLTQGLPHGLRITVDWIVTIVGAIAIVLAIKAWVVNPYRIPSSSMEPTLHCARPAPRVRGALLRPRAREPLHLPVHGPAPGRHRRLPDAARCARRGAGPAGRSSSG